MAPPPGRRITGVTQGEDGRIVVRHVDPVTGDDERSDSLYDLPSTTVRKVPPFLGLKLAGGLSTGAVRAAVQAHFGESPREVIEDESPTMPTLRVPTESPIVEPPEVIEPAPIPERGPVVGGIEGMLIELAARAANDSVREALASFDPVDPEALVAMVDEAIRSLRPVVVKVKDAPEVTIEGRAHAAAPEVIAAVGAGVNPFLVGPAGTGKSHLAETVAEAFGQGFRAVSCSPDMSMFDLVGYRDASGQYNATPFREAWEDGHLFLLDEPDQSDPSILKGLNAALANSVYAFPDGMVKRHENFRAIAAANTWGTGATVEYSGQSLDASTLDRFAAFRVDYDRELEAEMVAPYLNGESAPLLANLWRIRDNAAAKGIRLIVSTRGVVDTAKLIHAGFTPERAADVRILKGLNDGERAKLLEGVSL